jgi:hypothetical protein
VATSLAAAISTDPEAERNPASLTGGRFQGVFSLVGFTLYFALVLPSLAQASCVLGGIARGNSSPVHCKQNAFQTHSFPANYSGT